MGRPANITLASARARARQIHPRVLLVNALLFNAASTAVALLWSVAICLVNGWGLLPGVFIAAGAAAGLAGLWFFASLAWVLQT
ncbi:MAG: hypothetical protein ACOC1F_01285, partial [Myxococcota bacterium]